jgi:hypothetical protein
MSYDVYFEGETGDFEGEEIWRNYTSNVSPMWTDAIQRSMTLGELIESYPKASDLAPQLLPALVRMGRNPSRYEAMNPDNGWGDFEGAYQYLAWIWTTCTRWPNATVRVSR